MMHLRVIKATTKSLLFIVLGGLVFGWTGCKGGFGKRSNNNQYIVYQVDSLHQLANDFKASHLDSMLLVADEAQKISAEHDYSEGVIQSLIQKGIVYFYKGNEDTSLLLLQQAENMLSVLPSNQQNNKLTAQKNGLKGSIYHNKAYYDSAAVYMYEAIQVFEKRGDSLQLARVSANLATNYILTEDYINALLFTEKAAFIFNKKQDLEGLTAVYERKGSIFAHQEIYDSALVYFQKSQEFAEKINHPFFIANGLHNIGSVYLKQGKNEIGINYLEQTIDLYRQLNYNLGLAMSLSNLGEIYFNQGNYANALHYYLEANRLANKYDFLEIKVDAHRNISELYQLKKEFETALFHLSQSQAAQDTLAQLNKANAIKELEKRYVTESKNREILQKELELEQVNSNRLLIILIAIIIAAILIFIIKNRMVENDRLREKNNWIKQQQKELKHRTENHLEQLSSLFEIYGLTQNKNNEVLKEAQSRVEAINLLYYSLEKGDVKQVDIQVFIQKLVSNILKIYGQTNGQIQTQINIPKLEMDVNTVQAIGQIINEALNNSLQYAFDESIQSPIIRVKLQSISSENRFQLLISDNGKGFDKRKETENSIGLMLIEAFVKSINGKLVTKTGIEGTQHIIIFGF
ncbi:MAG: tetratricopeptide repeat protein [Saprospiraceae bacterium]